MDFYIRHKKTKEIIPFDEKLRDWEEVEQRGYRWVVKKHDDKTPRGKGL